MKHRYKCVCPCTGSCWAPQTQRGLLTGVWSCDHLPTSTMGRCNFIWATFSGFTLHLGPFMTWLVGNPCFCCWLSQWKFVFVSSLKRKATSISGWERSEGDCPYSSGEWNSARDRLPCSPERLLPTCVYDSICPHISGNRPKSFLCESPVTMAWMVRYWNIHSLD